MTKTAGVEGTSVLATDFRNILKERGVPEEVLEAGKRFVRDVSVVKEALILAEAGLPNSMHDPTEGGVIGRLTEIAYASGTTVRVFRDSIPIAKETWVMRKALGADPLRLISSGVLLATVPKEKAVEAVKLLRSSGVEAAVIGEVHPRGEHLLEVCGSSSCEFIDDVVVQDELIRLTAKHLR
ncbi:MAG: hypothetical protein J7L55_05875 [Desulfurococcales archaeon]|nr:hypothetical protein [Desulfurococcales archaeon]